MRTRTLVISSIGVLSLAGLAVAQDSGIRSIVGNVFLQDTTPGTAQIGHANIKGTFRAGQVNVTSVNSTIPVIGNNNATDIAGIGASFSTAGKDGIAVRGTATATTGFGYGVYGEARASNGVGVQGTSFLGFGVEGRTFGTSGVTAAGVRALSQSAGVPALVATNLVTGRGADITGDLTLLGNSDIIAKNVAGNVLMKSFLQTTGADFRVQGTDPGDFAGIAAFSTFQALTIERNSQIRIQAVIGQDNVARFAAEVKNFVQPDPDDRERDIVYACVEGPEAAAYVRGTARLVNGVASVALPRHFENVSVGEGVTVQVTPLSPDSEGLAVVQKSNSGFEVRELRRGRGNYEFDWEVKAVRRGFTGYKVYRPWDENVLPGTDRDAAMAGRTAHAREVYGIKYSAKGP